MLTSSAADAIEYRIRADSIVRTRRRSDEVERTETFRLPSGGTARLMVSGKPGQAVASLLIDRKTGKRGDGSSREFRVDARLGRDHRFAGEGE